jgi:nicotinate-nucleotide adenylyltransferase
MGVSPRCVAVLGGTFDPVHHGHVALGRHFSRLLRADELRVIPAGQPWQKDGVRTEARHRVAMARLAFADAGIDAVLDTQEIDRAGPTYTIDTLRALRRELGPRASLALLMGADQLRRLDTWRDWQALFDHAHLCVAARPGYTLEEYDVPEPVARQFAQRRAGPERIRSAPHGHACLAENLAVDISATQIREALAQGKRPVSLIAPVVLDYIEQYHLYKS